MKDIDGLILELVNYALMNELIEEDDKIYVTNRLLEVFEKIGLDTDSEAIKGDVESKKHITRRIAEILSDCLETAINDGLIEDTQLNKDLFDTKIMGVLTPMPSVVRKHFKELYNNSPKFATDYFYELNKACNYIRCDRIEKDQKWKYNSEYGTIDITINLSKPEKDPKDIIRQGQMTASGYPKCLLCKENEGYAGTLSHPARQNLRVIPLELSGEKYYMQYSPYVYYNEHCIVFNGQHVPMKIDKAAFRKLFDFVKLFPHYFLGSNADLPIVGGSILSHDHFQGGNYTFAMAKADIIKEFSVDGFDDVKCGIVKWPLSVIRLQSKDSDRIIELADHILKAWRGYTDEDAFIYAETDGTPHNTITPIARFKDGMFELDLALRNNITTEEHPLGVYHPHEELHHIKKENIGLIEVMGLAVLPSRLKGEMNLLAEYILEGKDIRENEAIEKHADWAYDFLANYDDVNKDNVMDIIQAEIGKVFVKVLEDAGVYKCTPDGLEAFLRFIKTL